MAHLLYITGVNEDVVDTEGDDADHDSRVGMEWNPSYVALAGVHTCDSDSNTNTANVHLQAIPSYIALPRMVSQEQSLPASRSASACNLGQQSKVMTIAPAYRADSADVLI